MFIDMNAFMCVTVALFIQYIVLHDSLHSFHDLKEILTAYFVVMQMATVLACLKQTLSML